MLETGSQGEHWQDRQTLGFRRSPPVLSHAHSQMFSIRSRAEDREKPRRQPPAGMKFDVVGPVSIRSRAEDREKLGSDAQALVLRRRRP